MSYLYDKTEKEFGSNQAILCGFFSLLKIDGQGHAELRPSQQQLKTVNSEIKKRKPSVITSSKRTDTESTEERNHAE